MSYTSVAFIAFLIIIFPAYFFTPKKFKYIMLLTVSMIFYIINSKFLTFFMIGSTLLTYGAGLLLEKQNAMFKEKKKELEKEQRKLLKKQVDSKKKLILTLAVIVDIGILLVLKYTPFFMSAANTILGAELEIIRFTLPLGISYYTLTTVSYMADVFRGQVHAEKNPLKLLLFVSFFPHIVEGPFARYGELGKTLFEGTPFDFDRFVNGFMRILYGLIKKMIFADRAGIFVNSVFENPDTAAGGNLLLAAIFYTFQIYAEFSGCMDIVIGVGEAFGIIMTENFRRPFFSKSIDEFWRRWHITLGAWLKDYIFYPMSFSKPMKKLASSSLNKFGDYYGSLVSSVIPLFCVWFTNGLWHGASIKYIVYGLYYFALMMLGKFLKPLTDKLIAKLKINTESKAWAVFSYLRTDLIVLFGMLMFRSKSLSETGMITKRIFTEFGFTSIFCENFCIYDLLIVIIGVVLLFVFGVLMEKGVDIRKKLGESKFIFTWLLLLAMSFLLIVFGKYGAGSGASPFIYGQF